jgi:uncharacterized protein (UPF0332 family)
MNMADFWEKAEEASKVAEWAYQNGCYNEAVSRSYFAALRVALALLEAIGFRVTETKRIHFWVQSTFARECIHRRKLAPPQGLYRGKRNLSNSNTLIPHAANNLAAVAPAGPAPTTITSAS